MITKTQRKKLKKILGISYADEVVDILNSSGKVNKQGNPHNATYVKQVFSGYRNNEDVEAAIYDLAEFRKEQLELEMARRAEILETKKPEPETSGHS